MRLETDRGGLKPTRACLLRTVLAARHQGCPRVLARLSTTPSIGHVERVRTSASARVSPPTPVWCPKKPTPGTSCLRSRRPTLACCLLSAARTTCRPWSACARGRWLPRRPRARDVRPHRASKPRLPGQASLAKPPWPSLPGRASTVSSRLLTRSGSPKCSVAGSVSAAAESGQTRRALCGLLSSIGPGRGRALPLAWSVGCVKTLSRGPRADAQRTAGGGVVVLGGEGLK